MSFTIYPPSKFSLPVLLGEHPPYPRTQGKRDPFSGEEPRYEARMDVLWDVLAGVVGKILIEDK